MLKALIKKGKAFFFLLNENKSLCFWPGPGHSLSSFPLGQLSLGLLGPCCCLLSLILGVGLPVLALNLSFLGLVGKNNSALAQSQLSDQYRSVFAYNGEAGNVSLISAWGVYVDRARYLL